jgi:hypothetical protein
LQPLVGAQATFGRITFVGMEDARVDRRDTRQVRQAEWLAELWSGPSGVRVSAGGGVRREATGQNVLLSRVVTETPALAGHLVGNAVFERSLGRNRDALDFISTVAYSRQVAAGLFVGGETLVQDVEGFWDPGEADGGARVFVGPAVGVVPAPGWSLHLTAGRDIRGTTSTSDSAAFRALGANGFVLRFSAVHTF